MNLGISAFLSRIRGTRNSSLSALSLKARLCLVFGALIAIAVALSGLLLIEQQSVGARATDIALRAHSHMGRVAELRELLTAIDRAAGQGVYASNEIQDFRDGVRGLRDDAEPEPDPDAAELTGTIDKLGDQFAAFTDDLSRSRKVSPSGQAILPPGIRDADYQAIVSTMGALIQHSESLTFRKIERLEQEQSRSIRWALSLLGLFILGVALCGYRVISIITEPLSSLAAFLDNLRVEDDLPGELPSFRAEIPEVSRVTRSFQQVLSRLRGYRALNVNRLLIEKRRSDIIAAAINEGLFLLRGEEILYLNPVAERMMGLARPKGWSAGSGRGLSLSALAGAADGAAEPDGAPELADGEARRRRVGRDCARAILSAVTRTMPVDFAFEDEEGRKYFYLIQAQTISYDLIAEVEHSVATPAEPVLDRFQANTLVIAQDVTLVHEGQDAKGHFLGTLSHEIKTPVTSLTMATRLLQKFLDEIPNPTHRNLIMTCVEDVDRLRRLLDELLTLSRLDSLTQRLAYQDVDLVKLIKHQVQSFQRDAQERGSTLTFSVAGSDKSIPISVDPSKIAWAISNLLTNAIRHTPKGGQVEAQLEVLRGGAGDGDRVEVRVRDTGPGIEKGRQGKIFDKFSPYYDLRVGRSGSAGASLSIAREIVAAHGGKIWVSSEPGQGAQFCFTLPLKQSPGLTQDMNVIGMKGAYSGALARS